MAKVVKWKCPWCEFPVRYELRNPLTPEEVTIGVNYVNGMVDSHIKSHTQQVFDEAFGSNEEIYE